MWHIDKLDVRAIESLEGTLFPSHGALNNSVVLQSNLSEPRPWLMYQHNKVTYPYKTYNLNINERNSFSVKNMFRQN